MNSENCIKLSFLGDVTCDRPLLNASKNKSDAYDFSPVFSEVKSIFRSSDYVIANLKMFVLVVAMITKMNIYYITALISL